MGKLTYTFLAVFVACLIGYFTVYSMVITNPQSAMALSFFMFPLGIGMLVGIVGAVVGFILRK